MKKIAVSTVTTFLKEHKVEDNHTVSFQVADRTFEVQLHTHLSIYEKGAFIRRVLSGCFDSSENFRPENVTPMLRATILQMCTNLPVLTLKDERDIDGGALMDMDAMSELYVAMDFDNLNDMPYRSMMGEMVHLCNAAIEWKKGRILSSGNHENVQAIAALADAAYSARGFFERLNHQLNEETLQELTQYASQLSEATRGLDEGGILKGLLAMQEKEKEAHSH